MRKRDERVSHRTLPEPARSLLSPYFPGLDLSEIRIHSGIPWYVPMRPSAYTDRNHLYFAPGCFDPDCAQGLALIGHELAHFAQYRKYGKWRFRAKYLKAWLVEFCRHWSFVEAYMKNEFELEASLMEDRIYDDLTGLMMS